MHTYRYNIFNGGDLYEYRLTLGMPCLCHVTGSDLFPLYFLYIIIVEWYQLDKSQYGVISAYVR